MLLDWIIFFHVTAAFAFFTAHGVSIGVAFHLRRERLPERLSVLLDLSGKFVTAADVALLVLLGTGITGTFMAHLWGRGWPWLALGLLVVVAIVMSATMSPYFKRLRKVLGAPYKDRGRAILQGAPADIDEVETIAVQFPLMALAVGSAIISVVILYLMIFKPF